MSEAGTREPGTGEARPRLIDRVPLGDAGLLDSGTLLDGFLGWVHDCGIEPYTHQEEALLEIAAGRHVVLSTPTGSGKSLVAQAMHYKALCEGKRSFYTAPIKALVNEKFFDLCEVFGPENVGMLTGDASINWGAPVICCTQEVLANMALRQGEATDAPYVIMDEFHYYADRDRGQAWQIPLLTLPKTTFLLMSATLGNVAHIAEALTAHTGREVAEVYSDDRPVPLEFEYRETPLQITVEKLLEADKAPVYVVCFTQRDAAEVAGSLTSARVSDKEERRRIAEAIVGQRFDSPYGKDMKRILSHGIGLHHAGLLPKYRLLVEQLSQQGLLKVIAGTDTLGVGVNIPIRTVLFTKLSKFDGEKVRVLSVRDFRQIAGRAGRKGFDDRGWVECQAPEHVIENKQAAKKAFEKKGSKAGRGGGRKTKPPRRKSAPPGFVGWNQDTFRQLTEKPPETLGSRFRVTHGMLISVLQRDPAQCGPRGGYGALAELIERSHETPRRKRRLLRDAAVLFRSLRKAEILRVADHRVFVDEDLQQNFSLHQTLSLYLVEAISALDPGEPNYDLDVVSVVEAVLDDPVPILRAQARKARDELYQRLKSERVPYEDRQAKLDKVTHPKPLADFLEETFRTFAEHHPWASREAIRPKSVAREMIEHYASFDDMVKRYGLHRVEGLLLRHLGQVLQTITQGVPDTAKTDAIHEAAAYLRALIQKVDSSLLQEWERRVRPDEMPDEDEPAAPRVPSFTPKAFRARVRAEVHELLRALAQGELEEAARWLHPDEDEPWTAERLAELLAPFLAEHREIRFDAEARRAHHTVLRETGPRRWSLRQTLLDPAGEGFWTLVGRIDLSGGDPGETPLLQLEGLQEA